MSAESWKAGLNCYASCGKCLHCRASTLGYKRAKAEDREEISVSRHTAEKVIDLAQLCLRFGRVNRGTYHEDGKRLESDTDHTVMLAVVACAFATQYAPHLDVGRIAQFAIVHDLVEAYAGDTNTLAIASSEANDKEAREAAALARIRDEFGSCFPWLTDTIGAYERLDLPEARFIKALDKVLQKVTHILNRGAALREHGVHAGNIDAVNNSQADKMRASYAADQPAVMALYAEIHAILKETLLAWPAQYIELRKP